MIGFALPQFGTFGRQDLIQFATSAERLGAGSLWVGDRLLASVDPVTGVDGNAHIPRQFRRSFDPFVALSVAAAVTTTPLLGSSVLVAPWYPPVQFARQLTSIDVVSDGRLIAGLGIGWSPEEFEAAGASIGGRGAQLDELLDVLDSVWTAAPVRYAGRRWSMRPAWIDLKPAQKPHPPVYLSAFTPAALGRIGRRADGFLPVVRLPETQYVDEFRWQRQIIDSAAAAAGRDPAAVHTQVRVNVAHGTSIGEVADVVRKLADNGFPDAFVDLMYVTSSVDEMIEWAQSLLSARSRG
ncbi:F420-dependent oxidoreductase [Mycolicibacterium wolinskyi]|uniref:F420-dependent oxidoreductase n=1 Tax=Mycolicibacterium wolinskyi TaxID=59750 RepID=A0A132PCU6_9MYCO|nr:TIGR03619 family F420-dependent LLM class oxidoreductase [Mycolicibacterium wolinskyi]KWX20047.1 F420-dependent oxidoreductase [Mycolicibacterium wolinskyi]